MKVLFVHTRLRIVALDLFGMTQTKSFAARPFQVVLNNKLTDPGNESYFCFESGA